MPESQRVSGPACTKPHSYPCFQTMPLLWERHRQGPSQARAIRAKSRFSTTSESWCLYKVQKSTSDCLTWIPSEIKNATPRDGDWVIRNWKWNFDCYWRPLCAQEWRKFFFFFELSSYKERKRSKIECSMESSFCLPFDLDFPGKAENIFSQYCTPRTNTLIDPMRAVGADTSWPQSPSWCNKECKKVSK